MKKEKEYRMKLKEFTEAYVFQKEALEQADDKAMTAAVGRYMKAARELTDFVEDAYGQKGWLPCMSVYFSNGTYHDFSYRLYMAAHTSSQASPESKWKLYAMIYIGEMLREKETEVV